MNRLLLLLFLYLTLLNFAFGENLSSNKDTLVTLKDIKFNSQLEQRAFTNYFVKDSIDALALLVATDPDADSTKYALLANKLEKIFSDLNNPKLAKYSPKKKVKYFYSAIHKQCLKFYKPMSKFTQTIDLGTYNCLTASCLYALCFEKFDIPYGVNELPSHVNLVAFPNTEKILIETTDPQKGSLTLNDVGKQKFVDHLKQYKLIAPEDQYLNTEALFNKYYFAQKQLGIGELIAFNYYNMGLSLLSNEGSNLKSLKSVEKGNYIQASSAFEKAYLFYPCEKHKFMLFTSLAMVLAEANYEEEPETIDYFTKLCRFKSLYFLHDILVSEFHQSILKLLSQHNKSALADQLYKRVTLNLQDEELNKEFGFLYNYERARVLFNQGKFFGALMYAEEAYQSQPENLDARNIFSHSLIMRIEESKNPNEAIHFVEKYIDKYPFLKKDNNFGKRTLTLYLNLFGEKFRIGDVKEGENYLNSFEKKWNEFECNKPEEYFIEKGYSLAAICYFQKGNKKKAIELLREGIKKAPQSRELKNRLNMLKHNY